MGVLVLVFIVPREKTEPTPLLVKSNATSLFSFEIASTSEQRARGLSGRDSIPNDYGMLFVFSHPDLYGFWMKDMKVAIDIIYLDESGTIIGIEPNISPETYPAVFYPPTPVSYVLETRAGEATRQSWRLGSTISLPK